MAIHPYTPLIYTSGQAFNDGQPYGLRVFDNFMHNHGGYRPGFQFTPSLDTGFGRHFTGLEVLISYHQNLYTLLNGLFVQSHFSSGIGLIGIGRSVDLCLGYYGIYTPHIVSALHLDAIFCGSYKDIEGNTQEIKNQKLGVGLCTWIKLYEQKKHSLYLFNELRSHYQCKAKLIEDNMKTRTQGPGGLIDIISGLVYRYKNFFVDGGFDYHYNNSSKNGFLWWRWRNHSENTSSSQAFNTYADLGFEFDKLFDRQKSASYCSLGIAKSIYIRNALGTTMVTFKFGIAF